MQLSEKELVDMLEELQADEAIDLGELPFREKDLRELVIRSLLERHVQLQRALSLEDFQALYLLTVAKLLFDNTTLHAKLLVRDGLPVDVRAILAPFTLKGKPSAG